MYFVAGHLIAFLLDGPCVMMVIFLNLHLIWRR